MRPSVAYAKQYFEVKGITDLKIAEVGVYKGEHALEMAEALNPEKFYLVDAYDEEGEAPFQKASARLKDLKSAIWIRNYSNIAVGMVQEDLDFIYLDAGHWECQVIMDIVCWFFRTKIGGIIAGHDFKLCDVHQAVARIFGWDFFFQDEDWWYVKTDIKFPQILGIRYPLIKGTYGWLTHDPNAKTHIEIRNEQANKS